MQDDAQTYLRKLQRDAINCALISKQAIDVEKEQLFGRLAENLALLAAELERAIETKDLRRHADSPCDLR